MDKNGQDTEDPLSISDRELERYRAATAAGLKTILFVCSGNAVRSQIAEGLVNHLFAEKWAAFSAGIVTVPVPKSLETVMREISVDISDQKEKHIDIFKDCKFDRLIMLCSDVDRVCPTLPDCMEQRYIIFSDPLSSSLMADGFCLGFTTSFRRLRDEMRKVLTEYMKES